MLRRLQVLPIQEALELALPPVAILLALPLEGLALPFFWLGYEVHNYNSSTDFTLTERAVGEG